jgi:hypothetical protein
VLPGAEGVPLIFPVFESSIRPGAGGGDPSIDHV